MGLKEDLNFAKITLFRPAENVGDIQNQRWRNAQERSRQLLLLKQEIVTVGTRFSPAGNNGAEKDDKIFGQILFGGWLVGGGGGGDRLRCRQTLYLGSQHCLESCPSLPACLATALYKRFKSSIIPNQTGRYMNILNTPKMNGN